ncbi:hypothetical protein ACFL0L_02555 [Patescibacteria group bacterium]
MAQEMNNVITSKPRSKWKILRRVIWIVALLVFALVIELIGPIVLKVGDKYDMDPVEVINVDSWSRYPIGSFWDGFLKDRIDKSQSEYEDLICDFSIYGFPFHSHYGGYSRNVCEKYPEAHECGGIFMMWTDTQFCSDFTHYRWFAGIINILVFFTLFMSIDWLARKRRKRMYYFLIPVVIIVLYLITLIFTGGGAISIGL